MQNSTYARGLALALLLGGAVGCDASLDVTQTNGPASRADDISCYVAVEGDGLRIRAINREMTVCIDGDAEACTIDMIDFTESGLDPDQAERADAWIRDGDAVADGWMERVKLDDGGYADTLHVTQVWMSEVTRPLQTAMYSVTGLDIVCVREPCPEYEALAVNRTSSFYLHYLDLEASGASGAALERGYAALERGGALLIGGELTNLGSSAKREVGLEGRLLAADTFYTRFP